MTPTDIRARIHHAIIPALDRAVPCDPGTDHTRATRQTPEGHAMSEHEVQGTATRLRELPFNGVAHQILYRFDPPLKSFDGDKAYKYVVASALTIANEVYLFGLGKDGNIADWVELPGSLQGTMNHSRAIASAGYKENRS